MKNFFSPGSFARRAAGAAFSRLGLCWRSRVRITAMVLVAALIANSFGEDSPGGRRPKASIRINTSDGPLLVSGLVGSMVAVGVGVYFIMEHAHTVSGCVSDDPNHLLLHTDDGKTYVLLGATTKIEADTRVKVKGTRKKRIRGITDQPTFVVEKLNKVYGPCSVSGVNP